MPTECGADLKESRHGYWSWIAGNSCGHGFEDATDAAIDYLDDWIRRETARRRKARSERNSTK